jgi:hypothetical protein
METVLIILVGVVAIVIIGLLAFGPKIKARQAGAANWVRDQLGGDAGVQRLETVANAFGSEPASGPQLRGPGALGLGAQTLVFALTPERTLVIQRSDIVEVDTTQDEEEGGKGMLKVTHRYDGEQVTTSWRLSRSYEWAQALRA